ncbi:MAG: gamma-glutamyltransferase family protein [Burkholderiaceae bacterium]|nr:gamma-glutamyltransferase family protein [Burkholderiaceae bacterium]
MSHFPFDWTNTYPTVRTPVFARNVVATSQPLAAQAGLRMLWAGGNAIDATVAAAAAITVVEPMSCGLGGDAFALVWDGAKLHGLNASGTAPAAWDLAYFERRHQGKIPQRGWGAVTVPGAVSGWIALHERFGTLSLAQVLAPAIDLARRGYGVSKIVQQKWAAQVELLRDAPGFAETFLPRGRAPAVGERFVLAGAADTLERIAASAGRDFYEGETAQRIAAFANKHDGAMTLADLRGYAPDWVEPISKDYRGMTLHEIPPNGQGIAALMALGMLSHHDVAANAPDSAEARHLQIEAMKIAFADVYQYVADPRYMTRVSAADLLDDAYLRERSKLIRSDRATDFAHGTPPSGGTIYLSVADERGMMVSFIQSTYMGFGSGVAVPGTGVSLQNRGFGFSTDPAHPNCVAPGKRPFHTIIPAFLSRDGKPQMSFGVMGGNIQPQGHMQTLTRMIDWHQNPQAACDAPRWKVHRGLSLDVERTMPAEVVAALRARGHAIEAIDDPYMDFGSGQFIWRLSDDLDDGYVAASDSRRDGCAAGF